MRVDFLLVGVSGSLDASHNVSLEGVAFFHQLVNTF